MKKYLCSLLLILWSTVTFLVVLPGLRISFLLPVLDHYCEKKSVEKKSGFHLSMPLGDTPFLPFLFTYNDNETASETLEMPLLFTVDYTFIRPTFFLGRGHVMNINHPYYGAFAGAYWVTGTHSSLTEVQLMKITKMDVTELMLPSFGLSSTDAVFEPLLVEKSSDPKMISSFSFDQYISTMVMSTPLHRKKPQVSYLLYGVPPHSTLAYPVKEMYGVLLHHYFIKDDLNLMLYAIASNEELLRMLEETLLQKSVLWKDP